MKRVEELSEEEKLTLIELKKIIPNIESEKEPMEYYLGNKGYSPKAR